MTASLWNLTRDDAQVIYAVAFFAMVAAVIVELRPVRRAPWITWALLVAVSWALIMFVWWRTT